MRSHVTLRVIRPGIRASYERDIFRVGNAAGESHPIIAEGISMALQSSWLLATELARAPSGRAGREAAGRRYQAAWRGLFLMRVYAAAAIARMALSPGGAALVGAAVRNFPASTDAGRAYERQYEDDPRSWMIGAAALHLHAQHRPNHVVEHSAEAQHSTMVRALL